MPHPRVAAAAIAAALLMSMCAIMSSPSSSYSLLSALRMWQPDHRPAGLSSIQKHFISSAVPPDMRRLINESADPCSSMYFSPPQHHHVNSTTSPHHTRKFTYI